MKCPDVLSAAFAQRKFRATQTVSKLTLISGYLSIKNNIFPSICHLMVVIYFLRLTTLSDIFNALSKSKFLELVLKNV